MSMFSGFLQKIADFLSDADATPAGKTKPGIQELAAKRLQALTGRFEMVEAQVRLAAHSRRDLQRLVAEAKAVEAIGKQAMVAGNMKKAEAAMARYAVMQQSISQMVLQAKTADEQAQAALSAFKTEAQAAQRAAYEAKALAQLENVIELQKKHQALSITQSTAADEFEAAREELLLSASVKAATLGIQSGQDELDAEIATAQQSAARVAIEERWKKELAAAGVDQTQQTLVSVPSEDPADGAIQFLETPPLGGLIEFGPKLKS